METAQESSTETDIHHDSNDLSTKVSEGTVNMETAQESSTETDIHHDSNDFSTKESEGTVNMETAQESSTRTDIHHDSNDLSTKESSGEKGEKEVNSGVVSWTTQTKKKTLVKMVDLGQNSDCSESEDASVTIIEHKISLQQEIQEPKLSNTLVNYTESSDTSDDCPQNVERICQILKILSSVVNCHKMPNHLLIVRNKMVYPLRWKNLEEIQKKRKK